MYFYTAYCIYHSGLFLFSLFRFQNLDQRKKYKCLSWPTYQFYLDRNSPSDKYSYILHLFFHLFFPVSRLTTWYQQSWRSSSSSLSGWRPLPVAIAYQPSSFSWCYTGKKICTFQSGIKSSLTYMYLYQGNLDVLLMNHFSWWSSVIPLLSSSINKSYMYMWNELCEVVTTTSFYGKAMFWRFVDYCQFEYFYCSFSYWNKWH